MKYIAIIVLLIFSWVGLHYNGAPSPDQTTQNAMNHVNTLAAGPRVLGSPEHQQAAAYITSTLEGMGLEPQFQEHLASFVANNATFTGRIKNILVHIPGSNSTGALLLSAHYDTVPGSPGAGDDAAGVAALLETAAQLTKGPPLKNDIILLFCDGEESGRFGAMAFVEEHPLAQDVRMFVNLEGRGTTGALQLFETTPDNSGIIAGLAKASRHPVGSSLANTIYQYSANDSDFSHYKKLSKAQGLNFSQIGSPINYHSRTDQPENLSARTLAHHIEIATSCAEYFGNADLNATTTGNAVFFNIPILGFISYNEGMAMPVAILALLLALVAIGMGVRSERLTLKGLLGGFVCLIPVVAVPPVLCSLVWEVLRGIHPHFVELEHPYSSLYYLYGMLFFAVAVALAFLFLLNLKIKLENLAAAGLLWCGLLSVGVTATFVGGSYLLTLPTLFLAVGTLQVYGRKQGREDLEPLILTLFAIPALLIVLPMVRDTFWSVPVGLIVAASGMTMVLLCFVIGPILSALQTRRWLAPVALLAATAIAFAMGGKVNGSFDEEHPSFQSLFYGMDADANEGAWLSTSLDPYWSQKFFPAENRKAGKLETFLPWAPGIFYKAPAPTIDAPAPEVEVIEDLVEDEMRTLRLRVTSPRKAPTMMFYMGDGELYGMSVDKRAIAAPYQRVVYYGFPEDGVELEFNLPAGQPYSFRLVDTSYGLPEQAMKEPMPNDVQPPAFYYNWYQHTTLVNRSFSF